MEVAVITGASMGLGEEFAHQLAARGVNLYLTARSIDLLDHQAQLLNTRYNITAQTFRCDLAQPGAAGLVAADLKARGLHPSWLINNAGFGDAGTFALMEPGRITGTLMVNMVALTELTRLLVPMMKSGDRIINISSTASFQPVPFFSVYAATKAYVTSFTEGLHEELLPLGIRVLCLCPGPTATNFGKNNGLDAQVFARGQTAADVVRMGLSASDANRALCVTQRRLAIAAQRAVPRAVVRKAAAAIARRMKTAE